MKNLFIAFLVALSFSSCGGDDSSNGNNSGLSNTPQAKAEFDNSNLGIYKGVFSGSSGYITVNVKNNGAINATFILDGVNYNFTTTETVSESGNISNLTFTSGAMSFDLDISNNGEVIIASQLVFPNHPNATINLVKEYSDLQVRCYEGTFTGTSSSEPTNGVLNVVTVDNFVTGLAHPSDSEDASFLEGTNQNNSLSGTYGDQSSGGTFLGQINGNSISGTWQSTNAANPGSGTWSGQRKL